MEIIEMGTISSRGQIAIPTSIREHLGLKEGTKVVFAVSEDTLVMKKVESMSWDEITKPLRDAVKKTGLKESDVVDIIHRMRKKKNAGST
jgi:AbrB family looped-hinge helix DNA binding protein